MDATRWLELCSRLPRSAASLLQRSSGFASRQHQQPHLSESDSSKSSATGDCKVQPPPTGDAAADVKSGSTSGPSTVLPALRHLLMKPLAGTDWIPPPTSMQRPAINRSSFADTRDPADSPPTLKREPLPTAPPKIKQEIVAGNGKGDFRDRLKTTSGFCGQSELLQRDSRPPRKRKFEICEYAKSSNGMNGCDGSSKGDDMAESRIPSKPEVERCPSSLSSVPPDIAVDGSPNTGIMQHGESNVTDYRTDKCFAHAPRKRFCYEFLSHVDDGAVANSARVDVGQNGNGNDVINLTTSTRVSSERGARTRDVAVQCVLTPEEVGDPDPALSGYRNPRRPPSHRLSSTCGCSTSADDLASFCWYCGIVFDDDVLHAIHMGCHSVADKFVCNVCGLECGDRYGFNSHLVRGHVQATQVPDQTVTGTVLPLQLPSTARLVPQTNV